MNIGIDPGTKCGWAVLRSDGVRVASGTWDCSVKRGEGSGMRFVRFERWLRELIDTYPGASVAYERTGHYASNAAAEVACGFMGVLTRLCEERGVLYAPVGQGAVKKLATGKGVAKKPAMIAAASARWGYEPADDNEADSLWIAEALRLGVA